MARYFIHRPAIWVFGGLLGIPVAMLQSESGALHHLYLRRELIMNIAARFRFAQLGRSAAE
jgi:hypothetical protein